MVAAVVVSGVLLVAAAVAVGAVVRQRLVWRRVVRCRVVVVLDTERSVSGVLFDRRGALLVLRDASIMEGGTVVRFDGEVVVERRRVLWLQVVR